MAYVNVWTAWSVLQLRRHPETAPVHAQARQGGTLCGIDTAHGWDFDIATVHEGDESRAVSCLHCIRIIERT